MPIPVRNWHNVLPLTGQKDTLEFTKIGEGLSSGQFPGGVDLIDGLVVVASPSGVLVIAGQFVGSRVVVFL